MDAFLMQMSTLAIAPAFFTAGIYVLLGSLIRSSFLRLRSYLWIFCTCDVISLVVQAIGGGTAASQASKVNGNTKPGTYIMVAGTVFQMTSITAFVVCVVATTFSVIVIYVRSVYRTIELLEGWKGYLITTEWLFIGLDGITMVLAVAVFNSIHPGWFLPGELGKEVWSSVHSDEIAARKTCAG